METSSPGSAKRWKFSLIIGGELNCSQHSDFMSSSTGTLQRRETLSYRLSRRIGREERVSAQYPAPVPVPGHKYECADAEHPPPRASPQQQSLAATARPRGPQAQGVL